MNACFFVPYEYLYHLFHYDATLEKFGKLCACMLGKVSDGGHGGGGSMLYAPFQNYVYLTLNGLKGIVDG